jgi:hypothetical protein
MVGKTQKRAYIKNAEADGWPVGKKRRLLKIFIYDKG